ncbi:STAS domain-containing protein [Streptomyces sp. NBC_01353]|uniref:STAS domain-containing protein n=1 Tax=Streptomyces sp. NBC_01353 TaxID=2903835 RepID=UPI002E3560BE|nr:STAS domain-containing protein [Streptomyces sp. NBC_01353]
MGLHTAMEEYGCVMHLTLHGELDLEAETLLDHITRECGGGTTVIACDMRHITFMDVAGLERLLAFGHAVEARDVILFVYNWRRQPLRVLELFDVLNPGNALESGPGEATRSLRRTLHERAGAGRERAVATESERGPRVEAVAV